MIAIAYYLLKVLICSSVLFLYYKIALQGKAFHQWNRFYLLLITALSLVLPCLKFPVLQQTEEQALHPVKIVQVVTSADEYVDDIIVEGRQTISAEQWTGIIYIVASLVFAILFILSLLKIRKLIRAHSVQVNGKISFIETEAPGTPFSFFHYIFWNPKIDIQSETGQQILQHEMVHVQEKHTLDKIFIQTILIFFWYNPIFWLIRKELTMVHEFIADHKAVGTSGAPALAAMILQASYPKAFHQLTNSFFQSSIKRRLAMLNKNHNPLLHYFARMMALPVLAIVGLAFSLKTQKIIKPSANLESKPITVVIDPGHGYRNDNSPDGAKADGIHEDDLVLEIAKKIKEANTNKDIHIILTREDKNIVDLHGRVDFANHNKADLFISLHVNQLPPAALSKGIMAEGIEVFVPKNNPAIQQKSELLGSALIENLKSLHYTRSALLKRNVTIYVLDKNTCPAVMIECGYMTNKNDLEFIKKETNQQAVAQAILNSIGQYIMQDIMLVNSETVSQLSSNALSKDKDNVPPTKDAKSTKQYGNNAKKDVTVYKGATNIDATKKVYDKQDFDEAAKTQKSNKLTTDTIPNKNLVFVKVEKEAEFPGGKEAWVRYLQKQLDPTVPVKNGASEGTYTVIVRFIVHQDGSVSTIEPLTKIGYGMEEEVTKLIAKGPKWKPAMQNGHIVAAYRSQPVTFIISRD